MMDFLKGWIINIVTLAVFIVLLEIILPSGKVRKFVSLISGFILIIAVINPFLKIIDRGVEIKDFQIASSNYLDRREIEESSKVLEDRQMKQISEVYRKKVISRAEEAVKGVEGVAGASVDVVINEDYKSEKFGEIKRLYINLKDKKEAEEKVAKIEKVEIGKEYKKEEDKKKAASMELQGRVSEKINKALGVDTSNIVITMD